MIKPTPTQFIRRQSLFNNALFSDCTIKCQDRELKAHKAIICRNTWFWGAFNARSGFKEAKTGVMTMDADDPHMVGCMLKYLCGIDYHIKAWKYLADTYISAGKYNYATLKEVASRGLQRTLLSVSADIGMPIADLSGLVLQVYNGTLAVDRGLSDLVVHFAFITGQLWEPADKDAVMKLLADCPDFTYDLVTIESKQYPETLRECEWSDAP